MTTPTYQNFKSQLQNQKYDVILIGSGIGSLSAAAWLAKEGKRCLVLEQHYVPGGFTHTFKRKGYEWDVGIHYIGEVHKKSSVLRVLFDDITNGKLKWAPMDEIYDRIIIKDKTYEFKAGRKNFEDNLIAAFPSEADGIKAYVNAIYELSKSTQSFFSLKAMPDLAATLARPFLSKKFYKYADQTTEQVIQKFTKDKELLAVLTAQYGDYGLTPDKSSFAIHALVAKHYIDGGSYPVGGSASIYDTIAPIITAAGGQILVKAAVKEIIIQNNKAVGVKMENGDDIFANQVVSGAGVPNSFKKFIPDSYSGKPKFLKKLNQVTPSLAHVALYIGLKDTAKNLKLPKTNYWIYPDCDHKQNIQKYTNNPDAALPVTYISFPSSKDPDWDKNYPERATIEIIGFTPYDWFKKWENTSWMKRGDDYLKLKTKITNQLLEQLYRFFPHLNGQIDHMELSSPLSTKHFCNYDHGEIYGIDHTPERFRLKWLKPKTEIKNYYLTGQDIVTDGIGGALFGGVLTASAILGKNVVSDAFKRKNSI